MFTPIQLRAAAQRLARDEVDPLASVAAVWNDLTEGSKRHYVTRADAVLRAATEADPEPETPWLRTPAELDIFRQENGLRRDWHEPDEAEATIEFVEGNFDNAMCDETESHFVISIDGKPRAKVNVALLLGWGSAAA